jgi:hypothetical protein
VSPTALYAASDVCYVAVSAEGHGGCGQPHSRPVVNGAPAKVWALDCPPCEDHLRTSQKHHWSPVLSEIPETHDERLAREDFEKRGAMDKDALMAAALARLTGLDLPETLAAKMSGVRPAVTAGAVMCGRGHVNRAAAKFCTECGAAVPQAGGPVLCPGGHENEAGAKFCVDCGASVAPAAEDPSEPAKTAPEPVKTAAKITLPPNTQMRKMGKAALIALAEKAGLGSAETGKEALDRLIAANNATRAA